MAIATRNPATGETLKTFDPLTDTQIESALEKSASAFAKYRTTSLAQRAKWLTRAADVMDQKVDEYARIATLEMGKTFAAAQAEVKKCASVCRYYAENGAAQLADDYVDLEDSKAFRRYLPLGPILAVMPWNFPFWQVFRFAAPALMAGNTALLKHASNVPQTALAIEEIFKTAGFPDGAFQTLLISSDQVEDIVRDKRIKGASLTGSEPAGSAVGATCGETIKPVVLELGGSDPFIIMPSADLDAAIDTAVTARTMNNGQSCIAAKRFIIHADIYDDVKARLKARFEALSVGDPMDEATDVGPLVTEDAREDTAKLIKDALAAGARRVCGAETIEGPGFFFRPGLLDNITPDNPIYAQELFAPVALLFPAEDFDAALRLANDIPFGLSSAIFTQDKTEQERAFNELEAGGTFINAMSRSDVHLPFGGIKRSGIGRELAREGIHSFCNIKTCLLR